MSLSRVLLLSLATLMATIEMVNSCSCMPEHPQGHACRAQFVILARILSTKPIKDPTVNSAHFNGYRLKIQQVYKSDAEADEALKYRFVRTPKEDSLCGVNMQLKQLYLITGHVYDGRAILNACNFIKPWNALTLVQRKGFRKEYYKNCACKVRTCWRREGCTTRNMEGCGWTTNDYTQGKDCQQKHSVCLKLENGYCDWSDNRYMSHCMTKTRYFPVQPTFQHHKNEALEP